MTARQYIEFNPELRERVIDHLFEVGVPDELEYYIGDDEMWRDPDGQICEQKDVEEAMMDINLYESDLMYIERRGLYDNNRNH